MTGVGWRQKTTYSLLPPKPKSPPGTASILDRRYSWYSPGSPASPAGCLYGDFRPPPAFFNDLLQTKDFTDFDPWVTQRFPLGHPEISTGSPKVFHRVTQGSFRIKLLKSRMPQTENSRCGDTEMTLAKKRRIFKNKTRGKSEKWGTFVR